MLTIRLDGKRVIISGDTAFRFGVSGENELIVEAPQGVAFSVGSRPEARVSSQRGDASKVVVGPGEGSLFGTEGEVAFDAQVEGQQAYAYLYAVLDSQNRPMTTVELTERVLSETAYRTESANPKNTLFTSMSRRPEMFSRSKTPSGDTAWGLRKWGGADMKREEAHG